MPGPLEFAYFQVEVDAAGRPIRLGHGSMGATYRAIDTHLRRPVALKVIDERLLASPDSRRRFFNEARLAARLEHPNIARVLYLSPENARTCFFAMELVEGETLSQRVSRQGPCPAAEALTLLRQVVEALIYLGLHQLVHRDIKPDNVILGTDPRGRLRVKLIDFGLAKAVSIEPSFLEPVETGSNFLGSAAYASPEQVRSNIALDQRSDFYSLGATLWHALTGAPPFTGAMFEVHEGHVRREPPWEKVAAQPLPVVELLRQLLAKDPAVRPADATDLARRWGDALTALTTQSSASAAELPVIAAAPVSGAAVPAPSGAGQPPRRMPWTRAEAVPFGCSEPSLAGFLARRQTNKGWLYVREFSPLLPGDLRQALHSAAQAAQAAPHPGLLRVHEVLAEGVVSEWTGGVNIGRILMERNEPFPLELVLEWLKQLAPAVDFCARKKFAGLSLWPTHWWAEFAQGKAQRTPCEIALQEVRWPRHRLRLDPLGAFDPPLEALAVGTANTALPPVTEGVAVEPVPHLAAALYWLLRGGEIGSWQNLPPISKLDAARNLLLVAMIERRCECPSVEKWAACFQKGKLPPGFKGPAAPGKSAAVTRTFAATSSPGAPAPPRASQPPVKSAPPVFQPAMPRDWRPFWFAGAILACVALLLAVIQWTDRTKPPPPAQREMPLTPREPETAPIADSGTLPVQKVSDAQEKSAEAKPLPPADFVNSLGMCFKRCPMKGFEIEKELLVSIWDTRVKDYQAFVDSAHYRPSPPVGFPQDAEHPVVMVSHKDASEFCSWLTLRERSLRTIAADQLYRLPDDLEWSNLVGIAGLGQEKRGYSVAEIGDLPGIYPWGRKWPPPPGAGNFSDQTAHRAGAPNAWLTDYDDGYAFTSPVGRFTASPQGLYDLAGNVWQWCLKPADDGHFVARGGSFTRSTSDDLLASRRWFLQNKPFADVGFRVVLKVSAFEPAFRVYQTNKN